MYRVHHSLSRVLQEQVKRPVLYKCITSGRISAMLENIRDPREARWNRMHERTASLRSAQCIS